MLAIVLITADEACRIDLPAQGAFAWPAVRRMMAPCLSVKRHRLACVRSREGRTAPRRPDSCSAFPSNAPVSSNMAIAIGEGGQEDGDLMRGIDGPALRRMHVARG